MNFKIISLLTRIKIYFIVQNVQNLGGKKLLNKENKNKKNK